MPASAVRQPLAAQRAAAGTMRDLSHLGVALAVTREAEARPSHVVRAVGLEEVALGIGRRHEVVDPGLRTRDLELLTLRGVVILVTPARGDALVRIGEAVPVVAVARVRVALELDHVDQAER